MSGVAPVHADARKVPVSIEQAGGSSVIDTAFHYIGQRDLPPRVGLFGTVQWFDFRRDYWPGGITDRGTVQM